MKELILILSLWIYNNDLPHSYVPPTVIWVSEEEICERLNRFPGCNIEALYNCEFRIIRLGPSVDISTKRGKSSLLHELVHHRQCLEGRLEPPTNCTDIELEAYTKQQKWLLENGVGISGVYDGVRISCAR